MDKWINLWTLRPYSPAIMKPVVEATVFAFSKLFSGSKITKGGVYWKNGLSNYFYLDKEFSSTVENLSKQALKSPKFIYDFFEISFKKARNLRVFTEKYPKFCLKNKSSKELLIYFEKFLDKFYDFYSYGTTPTLMGYRDDNSLYTKMNSILQKKTKSSPEKFSDYLVVLTNPPKRLKPAEQELEILKLATAAKSKSLKTQKEIMQNFITELKEIKEKFEWLSFDFSDTIGWDLKHYAKSVKEKINSNIEDNIKLINNYEKKVNSDFNHVCDKLSFTNEEQKVFDLIRNIGYYKWAREHEFQKAWYNIKFAQDELGKRHGLTTLESKYIFADEIKNKNKKDLKKIAKERIKNCLIMVDKDKGTQILVGREAKQQFSKLRFVDEKININVKFIKGTPACPGKVKGVVKIVNTTRDLSKMKQGNILVSQATSPDLLSGMKKAVAIITNEGGITCHAAIVSREMKKPCIIGTKIATKILHDGQIVEVDANKGVIKIIK